MTGERLYRTRGLVLKRRDFGEADRLLTVLTRDHGKVTLLAKGARKPSSRKAPHVDLFKHVDLLVHKGRSFGIVSQADTVSTFASFHQDLERLAAAHYMAELADVLTAEEEEAAAVYDFMLSVLQWLDEGAEPRLVQRYFELHFLDLAGYRPQLYSCLACSQWLQAEVNFFDPVAGGMFCPRCQQRSTRARRVSVGAQKVLRFLQRSHIDACRRLVLRRSLHDELENLLAEYVRCVMERSPKSSQFIETVRALSPEG